MTDLFSALLEDAEEELWADHRLMLYQIDWRLNTLAPGMLGEERAVLERAVYDEMRRRHELVQVWTDWPNHTVIAQAEDAAPDFHLDPNAPLDHLILTLVPTEREAAILLARDHP